MLVFTAECITQGTLPECMYFVGLKQELYKNVDNDSLRAYLYVPATRQLLAWRIQSTILKLVTICSVVLEVDYENKCV
jgi:hypothetical protein